MQFAFERLNSKLARTFKFYQKFRLHVFDEFSSRQIGFDEELVNLKNATKVRGYFQTYEYINFVKEDLLGDLEIRKPSKMFRNLAKEIKEKKPTVIHVRGGDYKFNRKTIGMLSRDYYLAALREVSKINPDSNFWIFSNDKKYTSELLYNLGLIPDRTIFPEDGLNDVETMKLMSLGSGIVICNSTFSWWAAYLNTNSKFVICPNKWFRGLGDPVALCPPNWIRVESSWEV